MKLSSFFFFIFISMGLMAQPETDIYLFEVQKTAEGYSLSEGKNITPRKGYDNQPYFLPDSKSLLYVAADTRGQTDVFQYNIEAGSSTQLTKTKYRSEYSPKPTPGGKFFSALTVERDSTQRIWSFPFEKEAIGKVLVPKVDSIGYYSWYSKKRLAAFVLTNPFTLQYIHAKRKKTKIIAENVGRCILTQVDSFTFVEKENENDWFVKSWSPITRETKVLSQTIKGQEDFCWMPDGRLLMGDGKKLFVKDPYEDEAWSEFASPGVGEFYRVTMSPDGKYLALVVFNP